MTGQLPRMNLYPDGFTKAGLANFILFLKKKKAPFDLDEVTR